jgi:hypothetical protein
VPWTAPPTSQIDALQTKIHYLKAVFFLNKCFQKWKKQGTLKR